MTTDDRPLSPHLQVYKPQLTSVLSILHRLTGLALAAGTALLAWWLIAASAGAEAFAAVQLAAGSWIGRLFLFGWTFALFYHLLNGIRHMFWDAGLGYELKTVYASGWIVVTGAGALTLIAWFLGYGAWDAL